MPEPMYHVEEMKGAGSLSLESFRVTPIARFEIRAQDGKLVRTYTRPSNMRGIAKRQAEVMCGRYEDHYTRTGKRFELELEAQKNYEKNKARIEHLRNKLIPQLQAELVKLEAQVKEVDDAKA